MLSERKYSRRARQPSVLRLKTFLLSLVSVAVFGCSPHEEQVPSYVLAKDKMVSLLVDIHLTEAAADFKLLTPDQINIAMATRYGDLFRKHGTTFDQFSDSYHYYLMHANELSEIYTEVVNQLSTDDSRFSGRHAKNLASRDSLRNVGFKPDSVQSAKRAASPQQQK